MTNPTKPAAVWRNHKRFQYLNGMKGAITSFAKVYCAPKGVIARVPYYVAIVKLDSDNTRSITLQICGDDNENIQVGAEVVIVVRKFNTSDKGLIEYSLKAKLI